MRVSASLVVIPASLLAAAVSFTLAAPASAQDSKPISIYDLFGVKPPGLRGAELDAAVAKASAFPLGSEKNPVRAQGPAGQRAYLARLRCSDGRAPQVGGRGSGMLSPFGGITDHYGVACKGAAPANQSIAMDMYHDHVEGAAVPGFIIVGP